MRTISENLRNAMKVGCSIACLLAASGVLMFCPQLQVRVLSSGEVMAPYKWEGAQRGALQDRLVLYYFGSSECPSCNSAENVQAIIQAKERLPEAHPDLLVKFVLVYLDQDFDRAREFAGKHGVWDEISIGSAWYNELAQLYLAESKAPAIPHVLIFKDWDGFEEGRGHFLKRRQLVGDYMGAQELTEWLKQGFPLWRLDGPASEFDGTSAPFEGKWSSRKRNNPGLVAELLEFTVCRTEEKSWFRLKLSEDGEPASVQCSDAMLVAPVKLTFTVRDDTTVARGECVLSLDARHMRLALSHTNGMPWRSLVLSRAVE